MLFAVKRRAAAVEGTFVWFVLATTLRLSTNEMLQVHIRFTSVYAGMAHLCMAFHDSFHGLDKQTSTRFQGLGFFNSNS